MESNGSETIQLAKSVYAVEAVLKAAARVLGGFCYEIREAGDDKSTYDLVVTPEQPTAECRGLPQQTVSEFWRELNRQNVRFLVAKRTSTLRNLIVGRALYHTCLQVSNGEGDGVEGGD